MKKLILGITVLWLIPANVRAELILSGSPAPITMVSGTTSGTMNVVVTSINPPTDVMGFWELSLQIMAIGGTGSVTFNSATQPATNYVFGSAGLGVSAPISGATIANANDFYIGSNSSGGVAVPGSPGANLLALTFSASGASGTFGVYALPPSSNFSTGSYWTDTTLTNQNYMGLTNGGSAEVFLGDIIVTPAVVSGVPEPSTLTLLTLGGAVLAGWYRRRRGAQSAA